MNALGHCEVMCAAFLGLRKAFDSLDHVVLLECPSTIGVLGTELLWFTDYLYRCVKVRGRSPHGLLLKVVFLRAVPLVLCYFLFMLMQCHPIVKYGKLFQLILLMTPLWFVWMLPIIRFSANWSMT